MPQAFAPQAAAPNEDSVPAMEATRKGLMFQRQPSDSSRNACRASGVPRRPRFSCWTTRKRWEWECLAVVFGAGSASAAADTASSATAALMIATDLMIDSFHAVTGARPAGSQPRFTPRSRPADTQRPAPRARDGKTLEEVPQTPIGRRSADARFVRRDR